MKNTKTLKTKITRIASVVLFLVCSLYGLNTAAQSNFEFKKPVIPNANTEQPKFFEKNSPAVNKHKSNIDWWEPDTMYVYRRTNQFGIPLSLARVSRSYNQYGYLLMELCQSLHNNEWVNDSKHTYTYDANNNLLTYLYQYWSYETSAWLYYFKTNYTYDANNNMLTKLHQFWLNNDWVNNSKYTYTYYADNNMQTELYQGWESNAWENDSKYTFTYDENNNNLMKLTQVWQSGAWANYKKDTCTYDANNNLLMELAQTWQNAWVDDKKTTYTYDANNNMLTYLYQYRNNNALVNYRKYVYTYDASNNMLTSLYQTWYWEDNDWVNENLCSYTYDANKNLLTSLFQEWDWGSKAWVNHGKVTYTYDASNNMLVKLYQMWQDTWVNFHRYIYTYDANNNCTVSEMTEWVNESWQLFDGNLILYYNNMKSSIEQPNSSRVTASYKHFKKLENERKELRNISIYPNPTNKSFVVDVEGETTVKLYNMLGKEVLSENANGKTVINISHLPNGVYNVQVFAGNKIVGYSKVVKQ
ncbi:MAG: T9SS type A sorting domain-containing protein [Lentimicrobiaceae bacterium]|nr:T9SS type A sorting domain-containing protein [Lentimicrobiaceae bacterium]